MASEHTHTWEYFTDDEGHWGRRCLSVGCEARQLSKDAQEHDPEALEQRLAQATLLLQRVRDKEQARRELQGFSLFRAPNTLLDEISAFLAPPTP